MEKIGKKEKFNLDDFIFRYKWWIGSILLILVMLSGGLLLWKSNRLNNKERIINNGDELGLLKEQISKQEARISELELIIKNPESSATSTSNSSDSTGTVAGASTGTDSTKSSVPKGKINLNTANTSELDSLPGIGPVYAERIIEYRKSHGGFKNITELKNIKGIGDKTFEKLKDLVII